jgi:hypothetical protein
LVGHASSLEPIADESVPLGPGPVDSVDGRFSALCVRSENGVG